MAKWTSILNPGQSVAIGVGLGVVDAYIFNSHLPNVADVRTAEPENTDVDTARRQAVGLCIAINGLVSVMTRDWNVFLIGGVVTVGMAFIYVHANAVSPATGTMSASTGEISPDQDNANAYPLADYDYSETNAA